jgi:glucan 1,3-beta-glucosidase
MRLREIRFGLLLVVPLALAAFVSALGTSCTAPLGAGAAGANDPFWQETISRSGLAPYSSSPGSYSVFRNVKVRSLHHDVTMSELR